jgi:hemolysin activation/secretion protein
MRTIITLPPAEGLFHSLTLGTDYKHFTQQVGVGGTALSGPVDIPTNNPIDYYPMSALYSATWLGKTHLTAFNAGVTFNFRGMGSSENLFENKRFGASGNFIYLRGDLSNTQDLPKDFKVMAKVQGQVASGPLIDSEQIAGGGLGTVRGYLEAEVLGDNGVFGTVELQSPSLLGWIPKAQEKGDEWRVYAFVDAGYLTIYDPLPEQEDHFGLASVGLGSRIRLIDHFTGSVDAGCPLTSQSSTSAHDLLFTFRVSAEF